MVKMRVLGAADPVIASTAKQSTDRAQEAREGLFRRRLGQRPGKQFGKGGIGGIGRRHAGKAPRQRQDFGREGISRRAIPGLGGRRNVAGGARQSRRAESASRAAAASSARQRRVASAASTPARASALRMTTPIAASARHR
jgi:hypothetical protein